MMVALIARPTPVKFIIGSRTIAKVERQLVPVAFGLNDMLTGKAADLFPLRAGEDGYRFLSVPTVQMEALRADLPDFAFGKADIFGRHYIDMAGDFDAYMAQFSGKTRSTLNRKSRKLAELSGGALDIRAYTSPTQMAEFLNHALPLSALTYQERLLDAGLPRGEKARADMVAMAAADGIRAYLLFMDGQAVAYLYLPIEGPDEAQTLVYAFLGFHPDYAQYSVGTVLQMEALRQLFAENRYRYFDFTEGEGSHKALFGTHSVEGASFIALKPTATNRLLLTGYDAFNGAVEGVSSLAERLGIKARVRALLKR
jgi:CelD/BcsL family acetyltransferase involved in cellulose biosynthesis